MENQVVIITGGSRGIGFGIGTCFAKKKASLVIADLDLDEARGAARELNSLGAVKSIGIRCDVTNRQQVQAMVEMTVDNFERIDVLVNNAGICPFIEFMEMPPDVWQKTIDVNLTGAFHCTQLVAER